MTTLSYLQKKYPYNSAVQYYIDETGSSWSNGMYYLGGHLPVKPTDIITKKLVISVQNIIKSKQNEIPTNSREAFSVQESNKYFNQMKELLQIEGVI